MYAYEDIKEIHLEFTDRCNAACPQCPRNDKGGVVNPLLPLKELTLDDIKRILHPGFVAQIEHLYACGGFGDPIIARDCLDIFRYFRACNAEIELGLHTNGGARSAEFWRELGAVLREKGGYVWFGIDGLEDTNHIYRRNVRWEILMRNVEAFIAGGGNARWHYLVFGHNEHQVDDARRLAERLGFELFEPKKSPRFVNYGEMTQIDWTPVKNKQGDPIGKIERPSHPRWQNDALDYLKDLKDRYGSMILEIGSFLGGSTHRWLACSPYHQVIAADPWNFRAGENPGPAAAGRVLRRQPGQVPAGRLRQRVG